MRSLAGRVRKEPLGGVGVGGTVLMHAALVLAIAVGRSPGPRRPVPTAYRVELIAAPPPSPTPAGAAPAAPAAAPEPRPQALQPVAPAPQRAAETTPARVPVARAPAAPSRPAPPAAARGRDTAAAAARDRAPGVGSDPATVRTEGVEFPFPGYLRNLVAQVYRRWHPPGGAPALEAEIFFFVHRDGSISGLQFVRRSGSFSFDLEAQGALEAAGRAAAFGALPAGYGSDVLPVSFFFSPRALR